MRERERERVRDLVFLLTIILVKANLKTSSLIGQPYVATVSIV